MFHLLKPAVVAASMLFAGSTAQAGEAAFLNSLDGNWSGKGTVKVRTEFVADQRNLQVQFGRDRNLACRSTAIAAAWSSCRAQSAPI